MRTCPKCASRAIIKTRSYPEQDRQLVIYTCEECGHQESVMLERKVYQHFYLAPPDGEGLDDLRFSGNPDLDEVSGGRP